MQTRGTLCNGSVDRRPIRRVTHVSLRFQLTLLLALLFHNSQASAYRTASDSPTFIGAGRVAWQNPDVAFALDTSSLPSGVSEQDAEDAIHQAIAAWSAPTCTGVRPVYVGRTTALPRAMNGVNTIGWVDNWADHGFPSYSAGSTDTQYLRSDEKWHIAEADIYLNAALSWSLGGTGNSKDIAAVLTHEMGHALGLLHPCEPDGTDGAPRCSSNFADQTMYPLYEAGAGTLAAEDISGICYLYPAAGDGCDTCTPDQTCSENQCVTQCGADTCLSGQVCGFAGCAAPGSCLQLDCVGNACKADSACMPLSRCVSGVCARGPRTLGEPCEASADCSTGVCVKQQCVVECFGNTDCQAGECTQSTDPGLLGCFNSSKRQFKESCSLADDCSSRLCVETDGMSQCTISCQNNVTCPAGWECQSFGGARACAPQKLFPASGCSVGKHEGKGIFWWGTMVAMGLLAHRRKRKTR